MAKHIVPATRVDAEKPPSMARKPANEYTKQRSFDHDPSSMEEITKAPPVESKSWDEYQACCKLMMADAREVQDAIDTIVKAWTKFEGASVKAYKKMPVPDAMFSDSPLSPMRMMGALRQNLAKLGWKWAAALAWGPDGVKTFHTIVEEAVTWGDRIVADQERAFKIELAKKAAQKAKDDIQGIV